MCKPDSESLSCAISVHCGRGGFETRLCDAGLVCRLDGRIKTPRPGTRPRGSGAGRPGFWSCRPGPDGPGLSVRLPSGQVQVQPKRGAGEAQVADAVGRKITPGGPLGRVRAGDVEAVGPVSPGGDREKEPDRLRGEGAEALSRDKPDRGRPAAERPHGRGRRGRRGPPPRPRPRRFRRGLRRRRGVPG